MADKIGGQKSNLEAFGITSCYRFYKGNNSYQLSRC